VAYALEYGDRWCERAGAELSLKMSDAYIENAKEYFE
jgi:hypothetical protein